MQRTANRKKTATGKTSLQLAKQRAREAIVWRGRIPYINNCPPASIEKWDQLEGDSTNVADLSLDEMHYLLYCLKKFRGALRAARCE